MKKIVILMVALAVCAATITAAPTGLLGLGLGVVGAAVKNAQPQPVDALAEMKLNLPAAAQEMSQSEKVAYYEANLMQGSVAKALLLGFGSASKSMGDLKGQRNGKVWDGIGIGLIGGGAAIWMSDFLIWLLAAPWIAWGTGDKPNYWAYVEQNPVLFVASMSAFAVGAGITIIGRIVQAVRVGKFTKQYNSTMREILGLDENLELAVLPSFENGGSVMLLAKLSF